jgi:hypothetical protein
MNVEPSNGLAISPSEGGTYTVEFDSGNVVTTLEVEEQELRELCEQAEEAIEMSPEEYLEQE